MLPQSLMDWEGDKTIESSSWARRIDLRLVFILNLMFICELFHFYVKKIFSSDVFFSGSVNGCGRDFISGVDWSVAQFDYFSSILWTYIHTSTYNIRCVYSILCFFDFEVHNWHRIGPSVYICTGRLCDIWFELQ